MLLELRMVMVVETTGAARSAKLPSNCHHQQTNIQFLQARCPSYHPTNSVELMVKQNPTVHASAP